MGYLCTSIITIFTFVSLASLKQEVLYSCSGKCMRDYWDAFKPEKRTDTAGWTSKGSSNHLKMEACDLNVKKSDPPPNSWLRSGLIDVKNASTVNVTFEFTIGNCSRYRDHLSQGHHCVNTIDLHINQTEEIKDPDLYPNPISTTSAYQKVATIGHLKDTKTFKTIHFPVNRRYVFLAFHNYGACSNLHSVTVSFNFCPGEILVNSLLSLPWTAAPETDTESFRVVGSCVKDTVQVSGSLYLQCESNGQWNISRLEGRCVCKENMENTGGKCQACPDGKYNDQTGLKCTVLPSAPRNANCTFVNQSAVEIRWLPPVVTGDQSHVSYDVDCYKSCDGDDDNNCEEACGSRVNNIPYKENLKVPQLMVTNLSSFVNYTFIIYAMNRVSEVAKRKHGVEGNYTTVTVRTKGSIPGKPEVFVKQDGDDVLVSWILQRKNGVIKGYHVTCIREDDVLESEIVITEKEEQTFVDLTKGKTYEFQVIAENDFGKGPAGVKNITISNGTGRKSKLIIGIAAVGSVGMVLILLITVFATIFYRRRKRQRSLARSHLRSIEKGSELQTTDGMGLRKYIDPENYPDLMELLSTFTSELPRSNVKLDKHIGKGEFANVYKGILKTRRSQQVVAVKVLRPDPNEKYQNDFLSEASIMCQFNHPNVVRLIGVVTRNRPMMILTEFLESGSLDHFLKARDRQFTNLQLVGMARGVACGMVYISEMNLIHRDLAARNVLVGENMLCKVSDFGLSRKLTYASEGLSEYQTQGGKIAVRWTAPEALQDRIFSCASDVWSFGIVLWEIMTYCDRPYWQWNHCDVINRVKNGYRLPPPAGCPKVIHKLMMECWQQDKDKRPKFTEIVCCLDDAIRFSEVLEDVLLPVKNVSSMEVAVPEFESVGDWLKFIKMEQYLGTFQAANIDELENVMELKDHDLTEIGVRLIGHRNKMNRSIKGMKSKACSMSVD